VGCSAAAAAAVGFHSVVVVVVDSTSLFVSCSMESYYGDPSPHVVGYASSVSISSADWHRRQQQQQQQQQQQHHHHHYGSSSSSSSSSHVAAGTAETAGLQGTLYITKSSFPTFSSHTIICETELYCVTRSNQ
jgi:hypothetical protein